ncbi:MAG: molybdopterin biosynthesis protein [Rhodobacterales bacterium]|nr:MAG: molybdopterin biosynthesis protein [Rhodobacterales bacterium]
MLFFGIAALIWGLGRALRWSAGTVWGAIGGLYVAVLLVLATLPADSVLRVAIGGELRWWLLFGGVVGVVLAYRAGLRWLRARAQLPDAGAEEAPLFSETELNRYARHIVLRELGGPGQKRLKEARVLVIGAGGLGSPVLLYLAAAGVGTIGVVDDDVVDNSNLQRQVIHRDADIGIPKAQSATAAMRAQNPHVAVKPYTRRLRADEAELLFAEYDVIIDGTDNFDTRYAVNRAAVATGKPLISGALSQWEGQLSVFDPACGAPCYRCVFPEAPAAGLAPSCSEAGVVGPLPGVIGTMMAMEAIKLIARTGHVLRGEMVIWDGLWGESRKIRVKRRADCPDCGHVDEG